MEYIHIDANPASATYGTVLVRGTVPKSRWFFADWAYVPDAGSCLWGIGVDTPTGEAYLYRFTQETLALDLIGTYGVLEGIPIGNNLVNFGAVFSSSDGFLYGIENVSGNTYRFSVSPDPNNLTSERLAALAQSTAQNDGARCINNDEPVAYK